MTLCYVKNYQFQLWFVTPYSKPPREIVQISSAEKLQFIDHCRFPCSFSHAWSAPKPTTYVRRVSRPEIALKVESGIQGHSRSSLLVSAEIQNGVSS